MLKQLSVYAENKKGNLSNITGILNREQINIWGSVANDSAEFGIIRMITSDPEKAKDALEKAHVAGSEIDAIIVAASNPYNVYPSTGCAIQEAIGAKNAIAFDITSTSLTTLTGGVSIMM